MRSFIFSFSMKNFLIKILPYCAAVLITLAVLGSYADGNTDDNYMHFAVKKPQNIILGDSRGSQGILPEVLKNKLSVPFDNFSLNIAQSPYGQVYLKALKRKLDPDTKRGTFILSISPWNVSLANSIKKTEDFPDENSPLNNMYFFDLSPNYEYLLKNYSRSWFKIYTEREEAGKSNTFLHKDGWMEVNVDMNKDSVAARTIKKIEGYQVLAKETELSPERLKAFEEIISYLRTRGKVYIVRIPASEKLMVLENEKFPMFSKSLKDIGRKHNIKVFDFSKNYADFEYTDGNHMYKESGKVFTAQIADSILQDKKGLK